MIALLVHWLIYLIYGSVVPRIENMSKIVGRKKLTNALGMRRNDSPYSNNIHFECWRRFDRADDLKLQSSSHLRRVCRTCVQSGALIDSSWLADGNATWARRPGSPLVERGAGTCSRWAWPAGDEVWRRVGYVATRAGGFPRLHRPQPCIASQSSDGVVTIARCAFCEWAGSLSKFIHRVRYNRSAMRASVQSGPHGRYSCRKEGGMLTNTHMSLHGNR